MVDMHPARLAEIMPAKWSETRRRVVAIRQLLQEQDQSGTTIMRYARELGVSRQMIYKLLRIVREWDEAGEAPAAPPRWSAHDPVADALIQQAISDLGTGAVAARVHERTALLAKVRGITPPSLQSVHTAIGKRPAGTALALRLSLSDGIILDTVRLAVMLAADDGPPQAAHLVAAFDLTTGDLRAWILGPGRIEVEDLERILADLDGNEDILATSAVPLAGHASVRHSPRRVKPGSVVRAALGASIGRMRILSSTSDPADLPVVSESDLREVLASVLTMPKAGS